MPLSMRCIACVWVEELNSNENGNVMMLVCLRASSLQCNEPDSPFHGSFKYDGLVLHDAGGQGLTSSNVPAEHIAPKAQCLRGRRRL